MQVDLKELDDYCNTIAAYFKRHLGADLVEAYKLGSLAHGGFSQIYSDIDMCLLMACREAPPEMAQLIADAKELNSTHGKRLSVFWGNPAHTWGRLPVLDRVDLLDHGVPLLATHRPDFPRPNKASIREALLQSVEKSWGPNTKELSTLSELTQEKRKPYVRCLLYPARLIYSWDHFEIASNNRAVAYLHEIEPPGLDLRPIQLALECRHERYEVESIFSERVSLTEQFASATAYIR
jgi:hypothetical protein